MIEVNNGQCGYEIESQNGECKLFCFDLTINGSKLPLGTVALVYPTELEALLEGEEWMRIHSQSSPDEIKMLLCRVPVQDTRKIYRVPYPRKASTNRTLFGVGVSI